MDFRMDYLLSFSCCWLVVCFLSDALLCVLFADQILSNLIKNDFLLISSKVRCRTNDKAHLRREQIYLAEDNEPLRLEKQELLLLKYQSRKHRVDSPHLQKWHSAPVTVLGDLNLHPWPNQCLSIVCVLCLNVRWRTMVGVQASAAAQAVWWWVMMVESQSQWLPSWAEYWWGCWSKGAFLDMFCASFQNKYAPKYHSYIKTVI